MSGSIVDTSILVDVLRKRAGAEDYVLGTAQMGLVTHASVVGELIMGIRDGREGQVLEELLRPFRIVHPTEGDSAMSLELLRRYKLSHGVGFLDCVIAATAIRMGCAVATINEKHFRPIAGLQVIRPY